MEYRIVNCLSLFSGFIYLIRCVVVKFVTTQQFSECCVMAIFSQHNKLQLLCCDNFYNTTV